MNSYKIIITGTTGMVGEGVLLECLFRTDVSDVLSVSRRPTGISHPKLKEYIVPDFLNLEQDDQMLKGFDACFFCAGVSSIGMSEADYTRITFETTIHFASVLVKLNPQMVFVYVSGAGTDSTEKGRSMWARVKGRTENALMKLPFRKVHNFRPAFMRAVPGQQRILKYYNFVAWMYPVMKRLFPNTVSNLSDVARAMLRCVASDVDKSVLEVSDINRLARSE